MLTAVAVCLALAIALAAVPMTLEFRFDSRSPSQDQVKLGWAFGLLQTALYQGAATSDPHDEEGSEHSASRSNQGHSGYRTFGSMLLNRNLRLRVIGYVCDVWKALDKKICARARFGLSDPADTGRLWAALGMAYASLPTMQGLSVSVRPDFLEEVWEFDASGSVRLIPLRIAWLSLGLLVTPAVWRTMRQARQLRP